MFHMNFSRWFVDGKAKGRKGKTNFLEAHDEKSRPELVDKFTSQIKRAGLEFRIYLYTERIFQCQNVDLRDEEVHLSSFLPSINLIFF